MLPLPAPASSLFLVPRWPGCYRNVVPTMACFLWERVSFSCHHLCVSLAGSQQAPVGSLSVPYALQQVQRTRAAVREVQSLCVNPGNGHQMAVALEGGV